LIIAEGIETPEEFETLERLGVCWGQGFYLAPPGPLADHGPVHR
jgi:EAL domain-containing protein (putative c-di-GMP-specific phosphodiesterase class I)